ncbi:MAG TPA: hypothetical protein DE147_10350 [Gammaproteobacteria bacterium]|jgi:hypothetical protein|nr:hypothetical protein [Gammaproteobacteria bacterium]
MNKLGMVLSWLGLVVLGLLNGILPDLLFIYVMVPYLPISLDLTGDLFWVFTVPLAELLALALTGSLAWWLLGLQQLPRLIVFWASWVGARTVILNQFNNPVDDIMVYVAWVTLWCLLVGLLARARASAEGA